MEVYRFNIELHPEDYNRDDQYLIPKSRGWVYCKDNEKVVE
jgi:hypothetical protein